MTSRNSPRRTSSASGQIDRWHDTYCPYCGVGCGLRVGIRNGKVAKVKGSPDHPSSLGDLCLKPIHLPGSLDTPDRIREPLMRVLGPTSGVPPGDTGFESATWERATAYIAENLQRIVRQHGP